MNIPLMSLVFRGLVTALLLVTLGWAKHYSRFCIVFSFLGLVCFILVHAWTETRVDLRWYPVDSMLLLSGPVWGWLFHLSSHEVRLCRWILGVMVLHAVSMLTTVRWNRISLETMSQSTGLLHSEVVVVLATLDLVLALYCYSHWLSRVRFFLTDYTLVSTDTQLVEIEPVVTVSTAPPRLLGLLACGPVAVPSEDLYPATHTTVDVETDMSSLPRSPSSPRTWKTEMKQGFRIPTRHLAHGASLCALSLIVVRMVDSILLYENQGTQQGEEQSVLVHQIVHVLAASLALMHLMVHISSSSAPSSVPPVSTSKA